MIEAVARRCSVKKGVLGNFTKFTGKHLRQSLFFNKVAGLRQLKSTCPYRTPLVAASINDRYENVLNVEFDNLVFLHWYHDQKDSNSNHLCELYCI